ncbi:efflux RND transporter periplasmic adaptor subunit [Pseudomarimonas arenosa]|uniref:Efflux RND transporter periplasmic adaptor subunit n=1 Tax=Pseudomarimonas arenosa TaxID=2774145 RepID=A0AAW3ZR26_9GAMM|nr:efflux RND transporter periplasmic adaptor subunit [Pseudomarimonas arenosa]
MTAIQPEQSTRSEQRSLSGSLVALQSSALSARLAGVVASVHAEPGQAVAKGDLIAQLDPELAELELQRRRAAVAEAEQRLAEAERLRDERQRLAQQRNLAQSQAEAAASEAGIARSVLARLQAELAQQQAVLRRHQLRAPFAGVVTLRHVDVGEWVDPSQPVVELLDQAALRFDVQVPQEWWSDLGDQTTAELSFDPWPGRRYAAAIESRVPRQDPSSRSFLLRLRVLQPNDDLTVGMSGQAHFADGRAALALSLPRDAVVRYPDGSAGVWIIESPQQGEPVAQPRSVRLGGSLGERVQVLEGLQASDWVVLRGNERLRAGEAVRVVEGQ